MKQYNVAVIGATGMVGQRFISLLEHHPWFHVTTLAASAHSAGKTYEQAVSGRWMMSTPIPEAAKSIVVKDAVADAEEIAHSVDFAFCAVDMKKDEIRALEETYAKYECPVMSNNSAHRFTPDVPMMIPEINDDHAQIIEAQRKRLGTKRGFAAAKYIGVVMKEIIRDATVYGTKYVTVVEIMGRNAGWLTAAAALAKSDDCEGVDMICLPEVPFNVEHFIEKVRVMQEKKPSIVIAVSEGVKLEDGRYVCELADDVHAVDAFGHKALTGTARYLANVVARNLDTKTRCIELSTLQRCAGHLTSRTDITEAYQVGGAAAKAAFEGVTGQMVALKRISNSPYQCTTELHPISEVANLEKKVPLSWMNANHTQMTDEFLAYARSLIQAELTPLYIAGLPHHIYMKNQK